MQIILPVTLATAAACALVNLWLAFRIVHLRETQQVLIGDGGDARLITRMRAQANLAEHAPIVLILLGLLELAVGTSPLLWGYGVIFILGRIAHGWGMEHWTAGRMIGALTTLLVTLGLAAQCAWTAFVSVSV